MPGTRIRRLSEPVETKRELLPHPKGAVTVIADRLSSFRMHQDRELTAIEHQPGHDASEVLRRECHLVHRGGVRANGLIAPPAELDGKRGSQRVADCGCIGAAGAVVIDVGVVRIGRPADPPSPLRPVGALVSPEDLPCPEQPPEWQHRPRARFAKQAGFRQPTRGGNRRNLLQLFLLQALLKALVDSVEI